MCFRVSYQCDLKLGSHLRASPAIMSSLSQKLNVYIQGVKKEDEKEEIQKLEQMTLPQLQELKISFGKAKLGQSYEQAFQDQSWTKWFIQTYETSPKPEHRKFIRFVTLKLEEPMPYAPKARPVRNKLESHLLSPSAQEIGNLPAVTLEEMEDQWEIAENNHIMKLYDRQQETDQRLNRIENALTAILKHLEGPTSQPSEGPQTWVPVKQEPQ